MFRLRHGQTAWSAVGGYRATTSPDPMGVSRVSMAKMLTISARPVLTSLPSWLGSR